MYYPESSTPMQLENDISNSTNSMQNSVFVRDWTKVNRFLYSRKACTKLRR